MPDDFMSIISSLKNEEAKQEGTQAFSDSSDNQGVGPDGEKQQQTNKYREREEQLQKQERERSRIGNRVQEEINPIGAAGQQQLEANENTVGADISGRGWMSEVGNSFMRGLGSHVIGGTGDLVQVIGAATPFYNMYDSNPLAELLQEKGDAMAGRHEVYMPEELRNPEFSIKTLTNPDFWSKHGAEYVPQLIEFIFLSKGAGAALKKGAQMGAKGLVKKGLVNTTKSLGNKSRKIASGLDQTYQVNKGSGIGSFIKESGELTAQGGRIANTVGAGAGGNIVSGMLNAAEAYNSRKDLKGKDGQPLFTKEELSGIAAQTFGDNLLYMGVDILSWGLTYGKANEIMKKSGLGRRLGGFFSKEENLSNISKAFTVKTAPALRKVASVMGKGAREGFEETFQETYEEWVSIMAESDVMGKEPKYSGFMEFYNSEENQGTRTISFAIGGIGGSVSGLFSNIDKDAERSRKLYNRSENLKTIFKDTDEQGHEAKRFHQREVVSDMILEDRPELFDAFVQESLSDGTMTEEQAIDLEEMKEDYIALKDQAEKLNVRGKHALFFSHSNEAYFMEQIEYERNKLKEVTEILENSDISEAEKQQQIEYRGKNTETIIKGLAYGASQARANRANLLLGKPIEKVVRPQFITDKNGQTIVAAGLSNPDYKYYVKDKDADILKKNNRARILADNAAYEGVILKDKAEDGINKTLDESALFQKVKVKANDLGKKAKSIFDNFFNKDKDETENTEEGAATEDPNVDTTSTSTNDNSDSDNKDAANSSKDTVEDTNEGTTEGTNKDTTEDTTEDTNEGTTEEEEDTVGDITDEELEELASLKRKKKGKGKNDEGSIDKINKRISHLTAKAKGLFKEALPDGLTKKTFDSISDKIKGKKPLTKKEQEIVDKFKKAFKPLDNKAKQFQQFVNNQVANNPKTAKDVKEATGSLKKEAEKLAKKSKKIITSQTAKAKKALSDAIRAYKKGSGPFSMESRGGSSKGLTTVAGHNLEPKSTDLVNVSDIDFEAKATDTIEDQQGPFETEAMPIRNSSANTPVIGRIKDSPSNLDKMMAVNQRLNFMFPKADQRTNAYILEDLTKALGIKGTGLSLAGAIFVQENEWDQGEVFMHEMAHVFFRFAEDRPETQEILNEISKDTKLLNHLAQDKYPDYVLYSDGYDEYGRENIFTYNETPTKEILEEDGATILPAAKQKYLLEEAFVAKLEGPLSKKYNKFFALKDEHKRIKSTRKWWKMISLRAKDDADHLKDSKELIEKLNDGYPLSLNNMRDYIVMEFLKEVPRIEAREIGFESRSTAADAQVQLKKVEIKKRLEKENVNYSQEEQRELFNTKEEDSLEAIMNEADMEGEDSENESYDYTSVMEKSFQIKAKKATRILDKFTKEYNRAIRLRRTIWGKEGVLFDKREFKYKIYSLAAATDKSIDFMHAIQESEHPDVQAFNKFLELRAPTSKTTILNSSWTVFSNRRNVTALKTLMKKDSNGDIVHSLEESISTSEQGRVQNMLDNMSLAREKFRQDRGHLLAERWANFEAVIKNIKEGTAKPADYISAYKFIASPRIKILDILESGFLNVKGKYFSPATVLKNFVDNNMHIGKDGKYMYEYNFKPIAQALAVTNREFTQDSVVENAKSNMVPSVIINNHMTKELDQMRASLEPDVDGKMMSKKDFIKRYSHITGSKSYRKPVSNQFLEHYYDSVKKGIRPDLVYYTGINDKVSGKANAYEDSTAYEQSFEDFMVYALSGKKKNFLINVGVFGDSPKKYYLHTNKLKMSSENTTAAYNIYRNINGNKKVSKRQFNQALISEGKKEVEFFNANGKNLMKIKKLKPLFSGNGKLNTVGEKVVKGYVYNQIVGGLFVAEVMSPNIALSKVAKRLKNAGSPVVSVNDKLKFESVFFKDPRGAEEATDGGMFILRRDAERWANAGKGVFDLNEGFKFLNYSVEKDNPNFKNKTVLLKGYTTILDEDFVRENPEFRGLYDLMMSRTEKYYAAHLKKHKAMPSMNFTDGLENSFAIAIPYSSEKTGIQKEAKMDDAPYLNDLNDPALLKKAEEFQDSLMYKNNKFLGLSAYNFGPQQVMDKQTQEVTLPVQLMNSILVHASNLGHLEESEAIQSILSEMMSDNMDEFLKSLISTDIDSYTKIVSGEMNKEEMDQVQRFVIEKYGALHPRGVEIVSNQLANSIKSKGNKLRTAGTYAHQKSSYGWRLPVNGEIKGSKELNGYTEGKDGLNRAEILIPSGLKGKVITRKYYTLDSDLGKMAVKATNKRYIDSSKTPKENDLIRLHNAAKMYADNLSYDTVPEVVLKNGEVVGYYVPGETVLATRVPSNGPSFTGVFEAVGFTTGKGNQVQVPTSFSKTIGADLDGDALFIQHKSNDNKKMNEVIDRIEKLWLSESMAPFIQTAMNTSEEGRNLKKHIEKQFPDYVKEQPLELSPRDRRKSYEDSMIAKRNIGTVFNLHRLANTLAAYRASILMPISVDGVEHEFFEDKGTGTDSRNHKSALIANLILDNLNENAADALNLNEHTISAFTLLVNLNVPIESVASMMNAPMVKRYVSIMNENNSAYHGYTKRKDLLKKLAASPVKGDKGNVSYDLKSGMGNVVTDALNPKFYSKGNQSSIVNLLMSMDEVNSDLQKVSKIMAGHKGIETNPYLLEKQISEFKRILNNKDSSVSIPEALTKNPDIKRYLNTAEATLDHTQVLSVVHRPSATMLLERLALRQGSNMLTDNQIKKYTATITKFLHSKISGENYTSKDEYKKIINPKHEESVFKELMLEISELKEKGRLSENLLLSQAMNYKFKGNKPFISLNSSFFDESLTEQEMRRFSKEFSKLPYSLQSKLLKYDFLKNGWASPLSMLSIAGDDVNKGLVSDFNRDFKEKKNKTLSVSELRELEEIIMLKDFNGERNNIPYFDIQNKQDKQVIREMQKNPTFLNALKKNIPLYFKSNDNNGKPSLFVFKGNTKKVFTAPSENKLDHLFSLASNGLTKIERVKPRSQEDLEIDLVTIQSSNDNRPTKRFLKQGESIGMEARQAFWDYKDATPLDQESFNDAMEFTEHQTEASKKEAFNIYEKEKEDANNIYRNIIKKKDLSSMSGEELLKLYMKYAQKNAYAYSIILTPVMKALAAVISAEQSKLTGRHKGKKDISTVHSWLMSNDIPSDHPEIQGMVRHMLAMEKSFMNEKKKYMDRVNKVTDALYKEKFGFVFNSYTPLNLMKRIFYSYIYNRKNFYEILYGDLIQKETINTKTGAIEDFKLKDRKTIESLMKSNHISKAQYDFYNMFKDTTKELAPFSIEKGQGRQEYIPHVNMSHFESFANRGVLGLLQASKSKNELLDNVKLYVKKDGKDVLIPYKDILNIYKAVDSQSKGNKVSNIKEYIAFQRKANSLLKKGLNEDGSKLQLSSFEMDSALSFGVMNRFSNSRSVKATEMPSMDLNAALSSYVHSTLFTNGNAKFAGFKSMQGVIDGIIALNSDKGFKNASKYVRVNWKDYYLNNKRQELFGKTGDKVVDFLTRRNLFAQLAFNAKYVLGNVAAGKYHNIKNGSLKGWAKGESRFWGMDSDSKNPLKIIERFKRAQAILKTINFLDINVYDDVSMSSKGRMDNFLGDLALMPMSLSEKWIQGVQMLGMLSKEQWDLFDDNGNYKEGVSPIANEELASLENEVKKAQGKGYQATDQRMIQQYSLGRMMLQFSRFIPTMFYDRFAKEDIDIYGKKHIGTLRSIYKTVSEVQSMYPKDYIRYRKDLQKTDPELANRLDSGLKGLAMSGIIGAFAIATGNQFAKQSYWDANYYADLDKFEYKAVPSALRSTKSLVDSLFE